MSVCARGECFDNVLSGISSRPLSVEAMIAISIAEDHDLLVRDLV